MRRYPRWAWWLGGLSVVAFYVWIFYYIFVGPFGFRWRALYGDAKYPEGYEIRGIDISHHQGKIDWELLRNAMIEKCPIRFILIKATEGKSILDPMFKENFAQARDYGFIRGAYHSGATSRRPGSRLISSWKMSCCLTVICRRYLTLRTSQKT